MSAGPGGGGSASRGRGGVAGPPPSCPGAAPPLQPLRSGRGWGGGSAGTPSIPGSHPPYPVAAGWGCPAEPPQPPEGASRERGRGWRCPGAGGRAPSPGVGAVPGTPPRVRAVGGGGAAEAPPAGLAASAPCAGGGLAAAGGVAARSRTPRLRGLWVGGSGGCSWRGASRFWGPAGSFGGAERSGPCCGAVLQGLGSRSAERVGSAVI